MTRPRLWLGILLCLVGGMSGYGLSVATRPADPPADGSVEPADDASTQAAEDLFLDWLQVSDGQRSAIRAHEPRFAQELKELRQAAGAARQAFAAALESPATSEQELRQRHEQAIAASNALEGRVLQYLVNVREHLNPEQQRRLFGLCAQGVREGRGWQWRGARDHDGTTGPIRGRGRGRGETMP